MTHAVNYSATMMWRDQPEVREKVARAALARGTKPSEWLRQAVRTALELDGIPSQTDAG